MDNTAKQKLLAQFRELLDDPEFNQKTNHLGSEAHREVDLFSLFSELITIKNEVRLQGRQFKSALDLVADDHALLKQQLQQNQSQVADLALKQQCHIFEQLLLLRDRIEAGIVVSDQYQPKPFSFLSRNYEKRIIQALLDGQELSLKRLDQLFNEMQVMPIKTLGRKFDARTMNAVALSHDPAYEDGVVSKQLRTGYCWNNQVLRVAEVRVNRIENHVRTNTGN